MSSPKKLILGIDIGTTSVKVCIVDGSENKIVAKQSKDTQANVPSELGVEGNKQDVPKIISALHGCVSRLPKDLLKQVKSIGVCGQMHGVMFWNYKEDGGTPWSRGESSRYDVARDKVSNLYTWQDSRCDKEFLSSLPKPESHLKPYSGYGCNTIFWTSRYRPDKLERYNCAGTIQDFAVAMICGLREPVMSVQIAASWGYFNTSSKEWNVQVLEGAGFPIGLLPKVVESGELAGQLSEGGWHGIPQGTPVVAALGDLQCSVRSALNNLSDAVLNISTSAQICFVAPNFEPTSSQGEDCIEFLPYFNGKYLAVAAALNGGNALASFISMLQHWTLDLGFSIPQSTVWSRCIELGSNANAESSLEIIPTLLGERNSPEQNASVNNIDLSNINLGQVFKAICKGIIHNLHSMMPREMLVENNVSRIVGIGSALSRNKVLQKELMDRYQMAVCFENEGDAAWGAALAALQHC